MTPTGELRIVGQLSEASNATFLVMDETDKRWVYKPVVGEAPLWDFPEHTLSRREVAAYDVSHRAGWDVVPLTLWSSGPLGPGSVQEWIEGPMTDTVDVLPVEDLDETWLPVVVGEDENGAPVVLVHRQDPRLRRIALFDLVINNTDRKVGHLIEADGRIFGVDHGLTFHVDDKPRSVLWGFAGQPLDSAERELLDATAAMQAPTPTGLEAEEWQAMAQRAKQILDKGQFPAPSGKWPAIPWPPF